MLLEDLLPQDLLHSLQLDHSSITGTAAAGGRHTKGVAPLGQGGGTLAAETPADKLLGLLTCLLRGEPPSLPDIIMLRTTLMRSANIYQPINLAQQIRANLDVGALAKMHSDCCNQQHLGSTCRSCCQTCIRKIWE